MKSNSIFLYRERDKEREKNLRPITNVQVLFDELYNFLFSLTDIKITARLSIVI